MSDVFTCQNCDGQGSRMAPDGDIELCPDCLDEMTSARDLLGRMKLAWRAKGASHAGH